MTLDNRQMCVDWCEDLFKSVNDLVQEDVPKRFEPPNQTSSTQNSHNRQFYYFTTVMRYSYACIRSYMPPVVRLSLSERWTWGVYVNCATILVRSVYNVRQAPDESTQVVTQTTDWKRSFTLSLSGVEPTVVLLSQDPPAERANHWAIGPPREGCKQEQMAA